MKQILHIFAKDVRRLWWEILLSIAMVAAFAWLDPKTWWVGLGEDSGRFQELTRPFAFLVPLSWWLLIGRVIQVESPVGDRQFWVTRPYEWWKLLAAKALFLAAFVYLPLFAAECWLLREAGFHPLAYLPGLFYRLLVVSGIILLPLTGIAAVTSNFVRMTLTSLSIVIGFVGVCWLLLLTGHQQVGVTPDPFPVPNGGLISVLILLCICAAVVTLQFATRRVLLARLMLLTVPFLIWLSASILNSPAVIIHAFPRIPEAQAPPMKFPAANPVDAPSANLDRNKVHISVPVQPLGVRDGDYWRLDALRVTVTPINGAPLRLNWQHSGALVAQPDDPEHRSYRIVDFNFTMSRTDFDRLKSMPVTLHYDYAFTQARRGEPRQIALPIGNFIVQDFGSCSPQEIREGPPSTIFIGGIVCRFPFRLPIFTRVETSWSAGPCLASPPGANYSVKTGADITDFKYAASGSDILDAPIGFDIWSVDERLLWLSNSWRSEDDLSKLHLCPGTPITFTQYKPIRVRTELTIENFQLPSYNAQ